MTSPHENARRARAGAIGLHNQSGFNNSISAADQFRDAIRAAGLTPPDVIEADGKLRRFAPNGQKHDDAGWYVLHGDGIPAGSFGDWRTGLTKTWRADIGRTMTPTEETANHARLKAQRLVRDAAEAQRHAKAAQQAAEIWNAASPVTDAHPYLKAKGIKPHGLRVYRGNLVIAGMSCGGALIVPLKIGDKIWSMQFISPSGEKRFLPGGHTKRCYFALGTAKEVAEHDALCIAEGFATAATIYEVIGITTVAAFSAGNLLCVAEYLREKFPHVWLIICGDIDKSGTGQLAAREAALAVGGSVVSFESTPEELAADNAPSDFNDLMKLRGAEAVRAIIETALQAPQSDDTAEAIATPLPGSPSTPAGDYALTVELIRGTDIAPEAVTWSWDGYLAAGKVHILGGAPGTGKTTISMAMAAIFSTGGLWPDGTRSPVGSVVIWSGEDDPADTLVPRLALSGADLSRVYFIADVFDADGRRSFDPARDMEPLRRKLVEIGDVRLLIIDPIVSAVSGDSHKNAEVRRSLQPLADLAASMRCALLGITHFSKGTGGRDPVERLTGSLAFGALARVVLVAAKHQEEGEDGRTVRLFLRAKSNIGPDDGGFEYDLQQGELKTHPGIFASSVQWGDPVEGAARELLATAEEIAADDGGDSVASVSTWLHDLITEEGGRIDRRDVMRAAHAMGHKERTVHRAREKLGLTVQQTGFGKDKRSIWTWPDSHMPASIVPIVPSKLIGTHGTNGGTDEEANVVEVEV